MFLAFLSCLFFFFMPFLLEMFKNFKKRETIVKFPQEFGCAISFLKFPPEKPKNRKVWYATSERCRKNVYLPFFFNFQKKCVFIFIFGCRIKLNAIGLVRPRSNRKIANFPQFFSFFAVFLNFPALNNSV